LKLLRKTVAFCGQSSGGPSFPTGSTDKKQVSNEAFEAADRERDEAYLARALYAGDLWERFIKAGPEAVRLHAEYETTGDEDAWDKASATLEPKFRKFRDADKGFKDVTRRVKAAKRAYATALADLRSEVRGEILNFSRPCLGFSLAHCGDRRNGRQLHAGD
jgi:hypothetical protein